MHPHEGARLNCGARAATAAVNQGQRQRRIARPAKFGQQGKAAQGAIRFRQKANVAHVPGTCQTGMVGDMATGSNGAGFGTHGAAATGHANAQRLRAVGIVFEGVRHHDRAIFGQQGQAHVASRIAWFRKHDIQGNTLGLIMRQQGFNQFGNARARPRPRAQFGDTGLVDIDDQDAIFRRIDRMQFNEAIAQPLAGKEGTVRRRQPLCPHRDKNGGEPDHRPNDGRRHTKAKAGSRESCHVAWRLESKDGGKYCALYGFSLGNIVKHVFL